MSTEALKFAIKKAGTVDDFAKIVGVTVRQVHNWKNAGGLPTGRVPDVAQALDLPMHYLRPDKFPEQLK